MNGTKMAAFLPLLLMLWVASFAFPGPVHYAVGAFIALYSFVGLAALRVERQNRKRA